MIMLDEFKIEFVAPINLMNELPTYFYIKTLQPLFMKLILQTTLSATIG